LSDRTELEVSFEPTKGLAMNLATTNHRKDITMEQVNENNPLIARINAMFAGKEEEIVAYRDIGSALPGSWSIGIVKEKRDKQKAFPSVLGYSLSKSVTTKIAIYKSNGQEVSREEWLALPYGNRRLFVVEVECEYRIPNLACDMDGGINSYPFQMNEKKREENFLV